MKKISAIDPKGGKERKAMCRFFIWKFPAAFRLNANAWTTTFLSLFCRRFCVFFFIFFWLSLFFRKHIANHFFSSLSWWQRGDVVKHVYIVVAFRSVIRIRTEKNVRRWFFAGGHTKKKGEEMEWLGGDLMEMVQITHKKMIWKRKIEENSRSFFFFFSSWQRKSERK